MKPPLHGLAAVLRASLGAHWNTLHPDIRARFTLTPEAARQSFTGTMSEVHRSRVGWLIAKLIAFVRILPSVRARNVPFEFHLTPAPNAGWVKERLYHFADGRFEFRSVMRVEDNGELVEQFPYGLGMNIKLGAEGADGDTLYFRDDGYFLRVSGFRLPLPHWLTVGRFTLAHHNIDSERFTVAISLDHPLFGRLFFQHGVFSESLACVTASAPMAAAALTGAVARAACPDRAHTAAPGLACP